MAAARALWLLVLLAPASLWKVVGATTGNSAPGAVSEHSSSTGVSEADKGNFKFLVSIQVFHEERFVHMCTGSIFSSSKVLTTGTCFEGLEKFNITSFRILAGTDNLKEPWDQMRYLSKSEIHPNFTWMDFDFAVVTVQEEFNFNDFVKPIPLNSSPLESFAEGKICRSGGWSLDPTLPDAPNQLQQAPLRLIDLQTCQEEYGSNALKIHDRMVCVHQLGQEGHLLDYGGPLVCESDDGSDSDIFLGSATFPLKGAPGNQTGSFFANSAQAYDWIISA